MKRMDEGKVSLVEFLSSIRYARREKSKSHTDDPAPFAEFQPQTRTGKKSNTEEVSPIRSAN